MTFNFQTDIGPFEIKKSSGGNIVVFPEVDGSGSVQVSSAIANVYRNGTSVLTPTVTIDPYVAHDVTGSRLTIPISSGLEYDEDYRVELEWTRTDNSQTEYQTIPFAVVHQPWGNSTVSIDDMMAVCTCSGTLDSIGQEQNRTAAQVASQMGAYAHAYLDELIRNRCTEDQQIRAGAILDRQRLHSIETKFAVGFMWRHVMTGDEDIDQATKLHIRWMEDGKNSFQALGNLRYDIDDDGSPDVTANSLGRSIRMTRVRY